MSLSVIFISRKDGKVINTEGPNVLIDEMVSTIKEKMFALIPGIGMYPGFVKLEVVETVNDSGNKVIYPRIVTDSNSLLFNYTTLPEEPIVYVTNIFDVMENEYDPVTLFANLDSDEFDNTYKTLVRTGFTDLTEDDLEFVIKLTIFKVSSDYYGHLQSEVEDYIQNIVSKQRKLSKTYTELEDGLSSFYQLAYKSGIDYNKYLEIDTKENPTIIYTNVSVVIRGNNVENGVRGRFIKLDKIFNVIELDSKVSFMALGRIGGGDPMIKVYNKLIDEVSDKEVKNWVLNEKKKLNMISYKKVKGLLLKYKTNAKDYMTINIQSNGSIEAKITFSEASSEKNKNINNIIEIIKGGVDYCIDILNSIQGVFLYSKRIDNTNNSVVMVDSITGSTDTLFRMNRRKLAAVLNDSDLSNNVFEVKDTLSQDVMSLYYKKFGRRESEDNDADRKGITVNIRDNPYKLDSSVITIYSAYNTHQIVAILKQLVILTKLTAVGNGNRAAVFDEDQEQKLKEKSHIKDLRKKGVKILSTKCQKPRQPVVNDKVKPHSSSYVLEFEDMKYVCPNKEYPYPGFTNENIVCCFKKDQRRRDTYIRNTKSGDFDVMVQPSNFKIRIVQSVDGKTLESYAIKVVSDYVEGFDETNAMPRYYYVSSNNELVAITNDKLIKKLEAEEENGIWLDKVPLTKIITEPPKNKCNFPPNINGTTRGDINAPCAHHKKNKIFGYNLNSFPCCFDKERDVYTNRKRKVSDITKQHILTSDKVLEYQRIGILPAGLNTLFNKTIHKTLKNGSYYRMGVVQNKSAFFNSILLALDSKVNEQRFNNSNEFRKYIVSHLENKPEDFKKLNDGNIALKYKQLAEYNKMLMDSSTVVYWGDVVDIVQRLCNVNIMVLDIPYKFSESTKIADYDNIKLICSPNVKLNKKNPFIVLLKRINTFEVIIFMKGVDGSNKIQTTFQNGNKQGVVDFFLDYHTDSCVRENVFPEAFPYTEMLTIDKLTNILKGTKQEVLAQIVNAFNKTEFAVTRKGVLIPTKESGIITGITTLTIQDFEAVDRLLTINTYKIGVKQLNAIFKEKSVKVRLNLLGITLEQGLVTSVLTSFGQLVPLKQTEFVPDDDLKVLDFKYYPDVNKALRTQSTENEQVEYSAYIKTLKTIMYNIKMILAKAISDSEDTKEVILSIIKETNTSRSKKIDDIVSIFETMITQNEQVSEYLLDFMLREIANEVINDNVENLLLNNLVVSDVFNPNEVIKRDQETVLLSIDEIKKWIKTYKRQE